MRTIAQTQTTAQFDTALRTLARQAATRYPGDQARIDRGLVIALNAGVTFQADGTALVRSQRDPEVVYTVRSHCDCPDATRAPDGRCKHRFATALVKRARATATTYARIAYHATLRGEHGTAIRNQRGAVWFVSDNDRVTQLYDADAPDLLLHGRVDLSAEARRVDLEAQTDLARIETHTREAAIVAA